MALLKRKPNAVLEGADVPRTPDLAGAIMRLRGEVEAFIDGKVMEVKQSAAGQSLPLEQLRHMITRGDSCSCRVAMNLLADEETQ
jgi:hypothetical protein